MVTQTLEWEGIAEEIREQHIGLAGQRLHLTMQTPRDAESPSHDAATGGRTIIERMLEWVRDMAPEELAKEPVGLIDNLDHYV